MVTASELKRKQKIYEDRRIETFKKVFKVVEKKIIKRSEADHYYTWYKVPEYLLNVPIYDVDRCKEYIINQLRDNEFEVDEYEDNKLLIKWMN